MHHYLRQTFTVLAMLGGSAAVALAEPSFNTIGYSQGAKSVGQWSNVEQKASDSVRLVSTPAYKALPNVSQFTVRPGDVCYGGERAEVSLMRPNGAYIFETSASGTQYFGFSIMLANNWRPPKVDPKCDCTWGIALQLHGPNAFGGASPAISFNVTDSYFLGLNGGNLDEKGRHHNQTYQFSDGGGLKLGVWEDFVIGVKFAADNSGAIEVWRRPAGQPKFTRVVSARNVATLQTMPSVENAAGYVKSPSTVTNGHYWKQGYYRSSSPGLTSVLALTGLVRDVTFSSVESAAFNTMVGP